MTAGSPERNMRAIACIFCTFPSLKFPALQVNLSFSLVRIVASSRDASSHDVFLQ